MSGARGSRLVAVLAALVLLSLLHPVARAADLPPEAEKEEAVRRLADPSPAGKLKGRGFHVAGVVSETDPRGDSEPARDHRADVLGVVADYASELTVRVKVGRSVSLTDPGFSSGFLRSVWAYIDVDLDSIGDFAVNSRGELYDLRPTNVEEVACRGITSATRPTNEYRLSLPAGCIARATPIQVFAVVSYDTDPQCRTTPCDGSEIAEDVSPWTLAVAFGLPRSVPSAEVGRHRSAGASRYETAVVVSRNTLYTLQDGTEITPDVVYLAGGVSPYDAMVGGLLRGGPVLLVPPCGSAVPQSVLEEVARIRPERVVAVGGPAAICQAHVDTIGRAGGSATSRISGVNRYATAARVVETAWRAGSLARDDRLFLASGFNTDALLVASLKSPVLLVDPTGRVDPAVRDALQLLPIRQLVVLGPEAVVPSSAVSAIAQALGLSSSERDRIVRLATDSIGLSVAVAQTFREQLASEVVQLVSTNSGGWADALAIAGYINPKLLVPQCGPIPADVARVLRSLAPDLVVANGGPAAICDSMVAQAVAASR